MARTFESFLLAFRAVLHADAAALRFHSGVQANPVLLRKIEAAQLNIDDLDAVIAPGDLAASPSDLGNDLIGSVGLRIDRDEPSQRVAADCGAQFSEQDVAEPGFGAGAVEHGLEELPRLGHAPQHGTSGNDLGFLQRQKFGRRRAIHEQPTIQCPKTLVSASKSEPWRRYDLCRLSKSRDNGVVGRVNDEWKRFAQYDDCGERQNQRRRPERAASLWARALAMFASGDLEGATRPFAKAKASPAPRRHTLRRTKCSVKLPRHARSLRPARSILMELLTHLTRARNGRENLQLSV